MTNTLVALFNNLADAQNVIRQLTDAGIGEPFIALNFDATGVHQHKTALTGASKDSLASLFPEDADLTSLYGKAVTDGKVVVTVDVQDEQQLRIAEEILVRSEPVDLEWQSGQRGDNTALAMEASDASLAIPLIEEEMKIGKRTVRRGGIRIIQRLITTPVQESVSLRSERVTIERRPADRAVSSADLGQIGERTFEVVEMGEEAVVEKELRLVEEMIIDKVVENHTHVVHDVLRKTEVDIEKIDAAGPGKNLSS